jgi:hypothetical protein
MSVFCLGFGAVRLVRSGRSSYALPGKAGRGERECVRKPQGGWGYLPALDGVRPLSVLAVLVCHANPDWLPGGFRGVDAFVVLSGFLIAGLVLTELRTTGRIALAAFWGRRAPEPAEKGVRAGRGPFSLAHSLRSVAGGGSGT